MFAFLIGAAGGYFAPKLEAPLTKRLIRSLSGIIKVEPTEVRALSFGLALLIAAVVADFMGSDDAFWLVLGGVIGLFGQRLYVYVKDQIKTRTL